MSTQELWERYPNLQPENHIITSPETLSYNCVSWISLIANRWIDFYMDDNGEIADDQSCQPYINYFQSMGFEICDTPEIEENFEKIALYENRRGEFTHVCRQLPNGRWASKLGGFEDIEHTTLESLAGVGRLRYGNPAIYMRRVL